jgi:hypothetical protein
VIDTDEDGLIGDDQSVLIDRNISRREDLNYPRHRLGRSHIEAD